MTNRKRRFLRGATIWSVAVVVLIPSVASAQDRPAPTPAEILKKLAGAYGPSDKAAQDTPTSDAKATTTQAAPSASTSITMGSSGVLAELHIREVDIRRALEMINVAARKNIVTTKEVTGQVTADLYRVTFREALDAILRANGYSYVEQGNFIFVMTAEQKKARVMAERRMVTRMFRLSYMRATDVKALISPLLSEDGKAEMTPVAEMGIPTDNAGAGGNAYASCDVLIVSDYEDNLRRIEKIIRELDVKPDQVQIEATLLRATLSEDNALGVDFNALAGLDFNTLSSTTNGLQSVSTGSVPVAWSNDAFSMKTDFNTAIPTGGLTFGFLSDNVGIFIRALESITDVTVMANPKLLVLNKQRGEVFVGREDGYLTTTFTENIASQSVEMLKTGTRLIVRPYIARDDYVRLEIHPEDSSGSVSTIGASALPSKITTEATSVVMVRDGLTIVIGGLFREETTTTRSQTPLIGNVPYLGALFRSTADATRREEVIMLITPRIVNQEADEIVSEQLKDQVERFRLGHRKNLRWWGRGRLAQASMRKARKAMAEANPRLALWYVDMALSMQPTMEEAIRLKERLTKKACWEDEPQYSAAKYMIQKMIMNELGKPVTLVIPWRKPRDGKDVDEQAAKALGIGPLHELPLELKKPLVEPESKAEVQEPSGDDVDSSNEAQGREAERQSSVQSTTQPSTRPADKVQPQDGPAKKGGAAYGPSAPATAGDQDDEIDHDAHPDVAVAEDEADQ
ncbi:MAG: secretin and TonB N-terminal domain-containing protein [Planctomycetes bacterium]|nr:secretin and TonB N-terminal domain-containing protein [Planctomycetota bacterium]